LDRVAFDSAIEASLTNTLKSLGEDSLTSVVSLLGKESDVAGGNLVSRLTEVDAVLDELFAKFSKIIKHVTILEACALLKLNPPKLGNSLFWMVEELRSNLWKARK
jgi:hypothetical protein